MKEALDNTSFNIEAAILAIGGKTVLSDTTAIVTETWIIWGEMQEFDSADTEAAGSWNYIPMTAVPGIAFRIASERFSWDIGAVLPVMIQTQAGKYLVQGLFGEDSFIPIPLISLTYRID